MSTKCLSELQIMQRLFFRRRLHSSGRSLLSEPRILVRSVFLGLGAGMDEDEAEGVVALELNLDSVVCDLEEWEEVAAALPLEGFELEGLLVDVYNQSSSLCSQ